MKREASKEHDINDRTRISLMRVLSLRLKTMGSNIESLNLKWIILINFLSYSSY